MSDTKQIVNELLQQWLEEDPDPVDLFEDQVAADIGLVRHPALTQEQWRRVRVQAIDSAEAARPV